MLFIKDCVCDMACAPTSRCPIKDRNSAGAPYYRTGRRVGVALGLVVGFVLGAILL